jgi:surfeit locus 1 family protein
VAEPVSAHTRRGPGVLVSVLALAAFAVLIALGTWQVERLQWKEGLLSAIDERSHAAPQPLDEILAVKAEGKAVEYRHATVTGRFLNDDEQFFFATHEGYSGYYVYTPLERADGSILFVNRGFVGIDFKDPATRPQSQPEGQITVTGLAREALHEKPSWIIPDNEPAKNIFYWKDIDAFTANAGLDPARVIDLYVDADASPNPGGWPVGGVTIVALPNNHLQYAVTWYGLAAALAAVFAARFLRRQR